MHIIFAGDLSGRSLEAVDVAGRGGARPPAVRSRRARRRRRCIRRSSASCGAGSRATRPCISARSGHRKQLRAAARSASPSVAIAPRASSSSSRGSVCAFVGEASSGKSTVLTAIWTLLEAAAPPPTIDDVSRVHLGRPHPSRGRHRPRPHDLPRRTAARHAEPQPRRRAARALPAREPALALARRAGDRRRRRRRRRALRAAARRAPLGGGRRRAPARDGHGAPARLEPARLRPPDRGAGALSQPAHAAASLPRAAQPRPAREPDPLLDARTCLPERRPDGGARTRAPSPGPRDDALPAGAARRGRGLPRPVRVRQRPRGALPRARRRCSWRAGPRS